MKYGEEHIENMGGADPTETVRMPTASWESKIESEQERNQNHAKRK